METDFNKARIEREKEVARLLTVGIKKLILTEKVEVTSIVNRLFEKSFEYALDVIFNLSFNELLNLSQRLNRRGLYKNEDKNRNIGTIAHGVFMLFKSKKLDDGQYEQLKDNLKLWWDDFEAI